MRRILFFRSGVAAVAILGAVLSSIAATPPAQAAMVSDPCSAQVAFIGVRGTNAPAGTGAAFNNSIWRSGGYGDQIQPIRDKYAAQASFANVFTASVNYPATAVLGVGYASSVDAGVASLHWIVGVLLNCPVTPAIIIAGHSQGADVVARAMGSPSRFTSEQRAKIGAILLLGDPSFDPSKNYANSAPGGSGILPARSSLIENVLTSAPYLRYGYDYRATGLSWYNKIGSWCFTGDWACSGAPRNSGSENIHNSYKTSAQYYYDWSLYMISDF